MTVEPFPGTPPATTAERRLITVLFADVVGSTALADRMDPEDWSGLIRRVVELMAAPIERYGGNVLRPPRQGRPRAVQASAVIVNGP